MPKDPPPLLGFNNNVRHQGRVFHIQTEDSGVKRPRIVTHLFADGGRILRTTRTDYAEHVGREDMVAVVKRLMKEQHKGMFISLRAGELDDLILEACGPMAVSPEAPQAEEPAGKPRPRRSKPPPKPRRSKPPEETAAEAPPPSQVEMPVPTEEQLAAAASASTAPRRSQRARSLSNPGLRRVTPSVPPPAVGELDFDVASLDQHPPPSREPAAAASAPAEEEPRESGTHQTAKVKHPPPPPPRRGTPVQGTPATAIPPPTGKYAPSRPAAIFADAPSPEKRSIFGESVISEKSLDEVILSYLAEDLETSSGE